ncbi:MAG TPA: EF2563 family selenium-dependent molybdenum hydroxylase system protein [Dehalococcoidia bacterium]|nr:EF2563 family selenium-dependent molybdenum hydroxylase system protein [Dehalococcoidia bacterium]
MGSTVLIKGAGEVASGVAHHLHRNHFRVCLTEVAQPLAVSRGVAFSEAVFDGSKTIEGVTAELTAKSIEAINQVWTRGNIPLVVDPTASIVGQLRPEVLIDAIMGKRNTGTRLGDAPLVIGLGTGFYAGRDVHAVVETSHSHSLGKVILEGEAEANTGMPIVIGGLAKERVVWAPEAGTFTSEMEIGGSVAAGQTVGWIDDRPLAAPLAGMLRGLIRSGVRVRRGEKLIEVDPVNDPAICLTIRDKMRVIAAGVLEAIEVVPGSRLHGEAAAC